LFPAEVFHSISVASHSVYVLFIGHQFVQAPAALVKRLGSVNNTSQSTRIKSHLQRKKQPFRICRVIQQTIPNRMVIYAKDIINITGRKERAARLLAKIRKKYNKKEGELISVYEFYEFTGLKEERFLFSWYPEPWMKLIKVVDKV
jgi:hypothetical protein